MDDEVRPEAKRLLESMTFATLLENIPDAVTVLGPDGSVVWANAQTARLLGTTLEELIGSEGLGRIHPDEIGKAIDGIAWAAAFPDRTAVVPYRLRRDDGTYTHVELKSQVIPTEHGDHLVLLVRDGATRTTLGEALNSVAAAEPVGKTAAWLVRSLTHRWPYTRAAVVHEEEGHPIVTTESLPQDLADLLLVSVDANGDATPWATARATGDPVLLEGDELAPALRALAEGHGLRACAVALAADPAGPDAFIVAWFDEPAAARLEWGHWSHELTDLLSLALEQRSHHRALWAGARSDPLTGLPNRLALFEHAIELLARARDRARDIGVVYVDLDGFKPINDRYGHVVGDSVLARVAQRIADAAGEAYVGRVGGDEFAVVLGVDPGDRKRIEQVADAIIAAVREPVTLHEKWDGERIAIDASAGLSVISAEHAQVATDGELETITKRALAEADGAMYAAKRSGRGRVHWSR